MRCRHAAGCCEPFCWPSQSRSRLHAQSLDDLPPGFAVVSGKHIDVITDMPLSDELRQLPWVFDAAMPQWCEVFDIAQDDLRCKRCLGTDGPGMWWPM